MRKYRIILVTSVIMLSLSLPVGVFGFEDWVPGYDKKAGKFVFAATVNSAGHIFGQYCYFKDESCLYLIGIGINCEPGSEYPALINADTGSAFVRLVCFHKYESQHVLAVNSFDDIDRIVKKATRFGIAVPMQNDDFKVARFSLRGATEAINTMLEAAELKMKCKPQNRSKPAEERL